VDFIKLAELVNMSVNCKRLQSR